MRLAGALWIVATLLAAIPARAAEVVPAISDGEIEITSTFRGAELLLFGAIRSQTEILTEDEPLDVVVVVLGPEAAVIVRHKERVAGVWANRRAVKFQSVPGFYFVAANKPLEKIAPEKTLADHEIGISHIEVPLAGPVAGMSAATVEEFRTALLATRQRESLYQEYPTQVKILSNALFRTEITMPSSVPVGAYEVRVLLFKDGRLLHTQSVPLKIDKSGIERLIFSFASFYPFFYGVFAVAIAVFFGWLASVVFRR